MCAAPVADNDLHFLPDLLPGERELARLVITAGFAVGCLSVRSRRDPTGSGWRHRLVDEHGTAWRIRPARTLRPLDAGQLQRLIDTAARDSGPFDGRDFAGTVWAALRLDEVAGAFTVRCSRFPALERHYADREARYLEAWGARR
jgi:hypothetical protein